MKITIAVHGTRGDAEPAAAAAAELHRRGHMVQMAVPPNLVAWTQAAVAVPVRAYGVDSQKQMESETIRTWYKLRNPVTAPRQTREYITEGWASMSETLWDLTSDADVILTGTTYQEVAANVAEARGLPLAALHYFPMRANNQILPVRLPEGAVKPVWSAAEWAYWRILKPADDSQRQSLGLPRSGISAVRRIINQGILEIQAYDKACFPGLAEQWGGTRPLVGALTLALPTEADEHVMSWISDGTPPIYAGFGSMTVDDPTRTIAMVIAACRERGERTLISTGALQLKGLASSGDVMIVPYVNHASVFPRCRAIIHHGGAGTTAASLRSGVPTLALWVCADQPIWARQIKRLGVGTSRRLSTVTSDRLRHDLNIVLGPQSQERAREMAAAMTPPDQSVTAVADLLEALARRRNPCG